jgi:ankyrin repeat protein
MHLTALALILGFSQATTPDSLAVVRALARGEVDVVLQRIAEDEDLVEAFDRTWNQRLLQRAVAMDLEVVVDVLLARGAAFEASDRGGRTALHEARSVSVAARLLAAGANPSARDDNGNTPLQRAVERRNKDNGAQAEALIAAGVPLDLLSAVQLGRIEWVREELESSEARRREACANGSVLLEAARAGSVPLIDELLAAGAPVDWRVPVEEALDDYFERPLTGAVRGGHVEAARRLLDAGAPAQGDFGWVERGGLQAWNGDDGDLLCRAIADDHVELVRLLVAHGADVHSGPAPPGRESGLFTARGQLRCATPLARAAWRGSLEIALALLDAGADPNQPSHGAAPLFHAALAGHGAVAQMLVDRGAIVDAWSAAALGWATQLDQLLALEPELVERRDPCSQSTVLQLAIERGQRDTFDVCVRRGAHIDWQIQGLWPGSTRYAEHQGVFIDGYPPGPPETTPLVYALQSERFELALHLIAYGAPVGPGARAAALQSPAAEATAFLRELAARGYVQPASAAEGRKWLGLAALAHIDDTLARERIVLLLEAGCTDSTNAPVAHALASSWSPSYSAGRARVLHELGFELDFVQRVQFGLGGAVPPRADLVRLRRSSSENLDFVHALYVPAARNGELALVIQLAEADETLRPVDHFEGALAAASHGRTEVVRALVERGAPLAMQFPDETRSLLHAAAEGDNPALISWLIEQGAELELADHEGRTPLHFAAKRHAARAVDTLLAAGAQVRARDDRGQTPLHRAASIGSDELADEAVKRAQVVLERLVAAGADRAARDVGGGTAVEELRTFWSIGMAPPPPSELVQTLELPH